MTAKCCSLHRPDKKGYGKCMGKVHLGKLKTMWWVKWLINKDTCYTEHLLKVVWESGQSAADVFLYSKIKSRSTASARLFNTKTNIYD